MLTLDLEWIRAQFPALAQEVNGRPAIFFDGPGGTQVPQRVIDAIGDYLARSNANTHGAFATSASTDATIARSTSWRGFISWPRPAASARSPASESDRTASPRCR